MPVKVKTVPGGKLSDCAYISGIMFRKTVTHKRMAKQIDNPRILLLSGGIEFTRTENRIASLETLFEQEEKYMEILVAKILKLKPDVSMIVFLISFQMIQGSQSLWSNQFSGFVGRTFRKPTWTRALVESWRCFDSACKVESSQSHCSSNWRDRYFKYGSLHEPVWARRAGQVPSLPTSHLSR